MEEASDSITNPPKHARINFSQSVPRDTTCNLGGRYPIVKGNYSSSNNKDYKTYSRWQLLDEIRTLPKPSYSGSISNLVVWDPQVWPKVIDRWETNAVRAWQNRTHSDDMWELLETLLRETIGNWYNTS